MVKRKSVEDISKILKNFITNGKNVLITKLQKDKAKDLMQEYPKAIYATELYKASLDSKIGHNPLSFSQFPVQSYMTTHSVNSFITCSSASATAMTTGFKTNNGVVNMSSTLDLKYKTFTEKAKEAGIKLEFCQRYQLTMQPRLVFMLIMKIEMITME